ncbi:MAG TPA: T9SS type A sorting domain-containing protein, partial [Chitinophagales bacterium]|nr:T9SS type A sorting domain-containing protein [Chitinophagales bacterium]
NPATTSITIQGIQDIQNSYIFDSKGALIMTQTNTFTIDITALPAGNYLLATVTPSGIGLTNFIKQ